MSNTVEERLNTIEVHQQAILDQLSIINQSDNKSLPNLLSTYNRYVLTLSSFFFGSMAFIAFGYSVKSTTLYLHILSISSPELVEDIDALGINLKQMNIHGDVLIYAGFFIFLLSMIVFFIYFFKLNRKASYNIRQLDKTSNDSTPDSQS